MIRLVLIGATLLLTLVLPTPGGFGGPGMHEASGAGVVLAAPAAIQIGDITFSKHVDGNAQPIDPQIEFSSRTNRVWASFSYQDNGGARLSYLIRANGSDWQSGDLNCCFTQAGRFAFPIRRPSGKDLGGAAYEVRIFDGDIDLANGGFGVKGTKAFD